MLKLTKLKLNALSADNLSDKEMNLMKGGDCTCGCGCLYQYTGGSGTNSNANANKSNGYFSSYSCMIYCDDCGGDGWNRLDYYVPRDSDFGY